MKVILLSQSRAAARHLSFSVPAVVAGICLLAVGVVGGVSYLMARSFGPLQPLAEVNEIQADLAAQRDELAALRGRAQEQLDALAIRMGELNARAIRLDALGSRLTEMADLDDGEFDFDSEPALGGPLEPVDAPKDGQIADFFLDMKSMDKALHDQEQQLSILEGLLMTRKLNERVSPKGRPVRAGYISSYFGHRADPFTGKDANHRGVDFAGKRGSDVIAVAAGVVTYSGPRYGYGNMVEVNHGNGYVTRYAHNEQNLVAPGDSVQPGQTIALMGSSGRATGPNLHFEVRHRGRAVNPVKFIRRTS
ncbi:MAG: M23 family metallopeptidase [Gammaproteobacteria bacterium]